MSSSTTRWTTSATTGSSGDTSSDGRKKEAIALDSSTSSSGSSSSGSGSPGSGSPVSSGSPSVSSRYATSVRSPVDLEGGAHVLQTEGVDITFEDICFDLKGKNGRRILDGVCGFARRGQLTALMGGSGAGKTSLLNILAMRLQSGSSVEVSGSVKLNGQSASATAFRRFASFTTQEDTMISELTSFEVVDFAARMTLGSLPVHERRARVDNVLSYLGLSKVRDTVVGSPGVKRGVSGGERKRINIATSLVRDPAILFLDEPTSGLDSNSAFVVIKYLQQLAHDQNKTIFTTIHQPSVEMLDLFDNLLILGQGGRTAYFGPPSELPQFCDDLGFPVPVYKNPADFFLDKISVQAGTEREDTARVAHILEYFDDHDVVHASEWPDRSQDESSTDFDDDTFAYHPPGVLKRFMCLLGRAWKTQTRSKILMRARMGQTVMLGLLVGIVFFQLDRNGDAAANDRLGLLFLLSFNQIILSMLGVISTLPEEKGVYFNEISNGLYSSVTYYAAKVLSDVPAQVVFATLFTTIIYWASGLQADAENYFVMIGVVAIMANVGAALGFVLAAITGDTKLALSMAPPAVLMMMIFSGFVVNMDTVPVVLRWVKYLNPVKWAFSTLAITELEGMTFVCPDMPDGVCAIPNGDAILEARSIDSDGGVLTGVLVLLALMCVLRVAGGIALAVSVRRHSL